ncbi:adenosylcobinamide-phosphate synthase CbiB [Sphingomonas sp. R1]|uniref:adenosylcobinamide-phosphate synthase CbiB n=1 Tax=Sphingomonas sp. R1 TaxID=399176 RepID=UPI0022242C47|nr:adenosylcobinamide-phosphate synthase CbiB [Sphingomonas sp. R1]UYY77929.1 adenosylcobinamide-phosphate synthase CbiB [Sphingomonas sp. R1]
MSEPVALVALALEAAIGWPAWLYARIGHPVGAFARLIATCEQRWNRDDWPDARRRILGVATLLLLALLAGAAGWEIQRIAARLPHGWLLLSLAAFPGLAQRSLYLHVRPVATALARRDLAAARTSVGYIVGRDTARLDAAGVARAAIESLAESFCDGIVSPLLWLLVGGLPGLWIYKAINTADSLIGHREARWRAFGWASARTDDLLNLAPARLSGLLLCLCAGRGWRTMLRDARRHASPNAGWPEAAMAGALGLRLAGPIAYDGVVQAKPWIGDGRVDADASDIRRGLALYLRACGLLWLIAGGVAWAL